MRLRGKVALVTGGAHRVGRAITMAFAEAGAHVVINYYSSEAEAERTAGDARALGVEALPVRADVADVEQVRSMVAEVAETFGAVDVLVNAASLFKATPVPTDDVSDWQRVSRILTDGAFYCANAVAPGMLAQGRGAIVNIIDLSAWQPWPGMVAHSVGKSALLALTRQLALEFAPSVRVNAVAPGPVLPPPGYDPEKRSQVARRTLLERWGTPQDVSDAVRFLVTAEYITGEVLVVDGGERYGHLKRR